MNVCYYRFTFPGGYLEVSEKGLAEAAVKLQKLLGYLPEYEVIK